MAKHIAEGVALGLRYDIYDRTGRVTRSETRSETEVQENESGGGGYTSGGTGFQASVSGNITSTCFQTIFLTDGDAKEHTIELQNYLVPSKPDHKLSMLLLTGEGEDIGSYFMSYNHSTGETYWYPKAVRSEMFPIKQ